MRSVRGSSGHGSGHALLRSAELREPLELTSPRRASRRVTGALADRFIKRDEEMHIEAIEAEAPADLAAQVDRLALRARDLASELEALRLGIAAENKRRC